jgi:hypothetical protein
MNFTKRAMILYRLKMRSDSKLEFIFSTVVTLASFLRDFLSHMNTRFRPGILFN